MRASLTVMVNIQGMGHIPIAMATGTEAITETVNHMAEVKKRLVNGDFLGLIT